MAVTGEKKMVRVADLIPYARNARIHTEQQVAQIAKSIEEFGFISPVLIDEGGNVLAGHGRLMAAEKLGITEVPCVVVQGLTDEQKKAYILVDNKLTELGGWDFELLDSELIDLDGLIDMTEFGFDAVDDADLNVDDLFTDAGEPKEKAPQVVTCPHCGETFEI